MSNSSSVTNTTNTLLKTASMVTIFSICERGLGFLYRIILSRTIGSEGLGIYQLALSIFAVFVTATASGLPITLSRLIAKHKAKNNLYAERQTVSAAILITLIFAVPLFLVLYLGHGYLGFLFSDQRCLQIFLILLYGFIFNSVYAVLRGSFWGNKQFFAYSMIELIEEAVMIVVGAMLILTVTDPLDGARKAAFAVVISYITSFTIAAIYFFVKGGKFVSPRGQIRPLLNSSMPITAMRTSTSLINSLVSVLLPARLMLGGMSSSEALSEYGVTLGMAMPILYMPATIIGSIALVLTPELSDSFYRSHHERLKNNVEKAIKVTILIACTLLPMLMVFGRDIGMIVYNSAKSGEVIERASPMLLPMVLTMITTSMLNSLGQEKRTMAYYFLGAAAMLTCVWFLTPSIGIYGLLLGQLLSHTICCVLNLHLLHNKCVKKPKYLKFLAMMLGITVAEYLLGNAMYPWILSVSNEPLAIAVTATCMLLMQLGAIFASGNHRLFLSLSRSPA